VGWLAERADDVGDTQPLGGAGLVVAPRTPQDIASGRSATTLKMSAMPLASHSWCRYWHVVSDHRPGEAIR
jgi:hypothetical protein